MKLSIRFASLLRTTALVTAVALLPATTAGLAAVDAQSGPQFGKLFAIYERIKTSYVDPVDDEKLLKGAIDGMLPRSILIQPISMPAILKTCGPRPMDLTAGWGCRLRWTMVPLR